MHWYSNKYAGASYFESFIQDTRAVAGGRPIWVTEFGLDASGGSQYAYTDADVNAFLEQVMPWMDAQEDVHHYAYFMDAPGVLIDAAGDGMSDIGVVYNNYTGSG